MKLISHYFPFFILTLLLYGLFFSFHKQSTIIHPLALNSGQQSVQLKFIETTPAEKPIQETSAARKENTPTPAKENKKPQKQSISEVNAQPDSEVKTARQKLQKAIQETSALNDARLKSELFARDLSLEPTTAKTLQESTEKMPLTKDKATKVIPPVATQEKPQALQKSKPVVKKKPAANSSNMLNQGVLQEAIVVSGKTPVYPRRAILRNQQGRVVIKLTVTSKGKAKNPQIINSSGYSILDNAVLRFIEKELFMPAHKGDEKITTEQIFSFRFELK